MVEPMHCTLYPQMCLFRPSISQNMLTITHIKTGNSIDLPLEPNLMGLETDTIRVLGSETTAWKMPTYITEFFTQEFGFHVVMFYIGQNRRKILGESLNPMNAVNRASSWIGSWFNSAPKFEEDPLSFSDHAQFLIISESSLSELRKRAEEKGNIKNYDDQYGVANDARGFYEETKLRPNIVLTGPMMPWEEDFWGTLLFVSNEGPIRMYMTGNCCRCRALDIDYSKGTHVENNKAVLKLLMKDRRVDTGNKYSPVFGRYGFTELDNAGHIISVGDLVQIEHTKTERDVHDWPKTSFASNAA
ncbi:hypothetical protein CANCADRAFT_42782 [Tortispora caseinolytica NRRL Y-17796]|uniref:MOSC domain-containing protein n=1 Tax=Tortispora caseinolytica NRRL Y-17796 TaxID=767744 RepID=A0A1E4TK97_9ASCO|nr:hypothetical protein CANCADRAFT_42782 [Tortispora caseinolytica NRRL Y-17796]